MPVDPAASASAGAAISASQAPAGVEIKKVNVRFTALLARVENLDSFASDNEITALFFEYEILCQTQDGQVIKLNISGLLSKEEIQEALQAGMDLRLKIAQKLLQRLKQIKDTASREKAARVLGQTLVGAGKTIDAAGLKGKGNLAEIAKGLLDECAARGINLGPELAQQLGALSASEAAASDKTAPTEGLSLERLEMLCKYDPRRIVAEILEKAREEEEEMEREAAARKEEERLAEKRLDEKRRAEKRRCLIMRARRAEEKLQLAATPQEARSAQIALKWAQDELEQLRRETLLLSLTS